MNKKYDLVEPRCDNCDYPTEELTKFEGGIPRQSYSMCRICFKTFLSKATIYPNQVADPCLYMSIGYIANLLLDAINARKEIANE
jgi:hypothetical protein